MRLVSPFIAVIFNQIDSNLNPSQQYPFRALHPKNQFFLNKYTEQAKVFQKKSTLQLSNLSKEQPDLQGFVSEEQRVQTIRFFNSIQEKYTVLNEFNKIIVQFGKSLTSIDKCHSFIESEQASQLPVEYLSECEKEVIGSVKIALQLDEQRGVIGMPCWGKVVGWLRGAGAELYEMEEMRKSNAKVLEMAEEMMRGDYIRLEQQTQRLVSNREQAWAKLEELKRDREKLERDQTLLGEQSNIDIIYFLKKQYYEFTNLEANIKQNQLNYKTYSEQLKCYRRRMSTFGNQLQHKYSRVFQSRYFAFLDAYDISLNQSIIHIPSLFKMERPVICSQPPKVKPFSCKGSLNEIMAEEERYQQQYFCRVQYYLWKRNSLVNSLKSLSVFLKQVSVYLQSMITRLKVSEGQDEQSNFFLRFHRLLTKPCLDLSTQIQNLIADNDKLFHLNQPLLSTINHKIKSTIKHSSELLNSIDLNLGPMVNKYNFIKVQLEQDNQSLQENIQKIKQFQKIYLLHTNRIKKSLILAFAHFFYVQKRYLNFGQATPKLANLQKTTPQDMVQGLSLEPQQINEAQEDKDISTGYFLAEQYRLVLNRFLFSAFTEWKDSQQFKQKLSKEVYIALNKDFDQKFSQIKVQSFNILGFPPQLIWAKELNSDENEFLVDLNIAFRGKLVLKISTAYHTFVNIPLELTITVEEFYSVLRLCFVNSELGNSWFSFIGQPILKFSAQPKIANINLDLTGVIKIFQNYLIQKLKKSIYPIRQKIGIPLSVKDQEFQQIRDRYKRMQNNLFN